MQKSHKRERDAEFVVSHANIFRFDNGDLVTVEVEDTYERHAWRLVVNGDVSEPTSFYEGILLFNGYAVVTHYWSDEPRAMVPFRFIYGTPL